MSQGLDYSYSHPDEACVARSGYTFVARYIGDPDPNSAKYLDAPELAAIRGAGLSVVVVRETTAGFMLDGDGAAHARASRAHCDQLGLFGIPIYYALDVDPGGLSASQIAAVTRFLQAAAAADGGGHNVGIYAAHAGIERWVGQSYCQWGWQTYAWSRGAISGKAHFRQYRNGQSVCGGTVDLNETYTADFGQWPRPAPSPLPPTPAKDNDMPVILAAPERPAALLSGNEMVPFADLATLVGLNSGSVPTCVVSTEDWDRFYGGFGTATEQQMLDAVTRSDIRLQALLEVEAREEQRDIAAATPGAMAAEEDPDEEEPLPAIPPE